MKQVFDTYDTKNQGIIKVSLLGKILRSLGFNPRESDVQRVSKEIDPDSNKKAKHKKNIRNYLCFILKIKIC